MSTSLDYHDISALNALFGAGAFLTLALPEDWRLAPGVARPEIAACHTRLDQRWVVSGDAWYVLHQPELRLAAELEIRIRGQDKPTAGAQRALVGGHWAGVRHWTQQRGFLRRWTVYFTELRWECPVTERVITVTLSSRAPHDQFAEVVAGLKGIRCH